LVDFHYLLDGLILTNHFAAHCILKMAGVFAAMHWIEGVGEISVHTALRFQPRAQHF
jgi:hypothetical protein